jgi:hypothetical protein
VIRDSPILHCMIRWKERFGNGVCALPRNPVDLRKFGKSLESRKGGAMHSIGGLNGPPRS